MAGGDYFDQEIWINGYRWKRVSGSSCALTVNYAHAVACGGDPLRAFSTASTLGCFSPPRRKKYERPSTKEGRRLHHLLLTKYGFGKSFTTKPNP